MKIKNKGKVYPSPSSSSSSSSSSSLSFSANGDYLSVLKLLPAAILAIASVLSLEDREVLAYLITRSMKTTTTTTTTTTNPSSNKKLSKKPSTHKPPVFDCDCFDCYRSYWFRWDSSPNRELIHQAIEAFEDHLTNGETEKTKKNTRTKRRDKSGRRVGDKQPVDASDQPEVMPQEGTEEPSSSSAFVVDVGLPGNDVSPSPEKVNEEAGESPEVEMAVVVRTTVAAVSNHKGLARKVLPDVLGLFNSRLWSLWSPNV